MIQPLRLEIPTELAGYVLEGILKNDGRDNRGELNDECLYALTR